MFPTIDREPTEKEQSSTTRTLAEGHKLIPISNGRLPWSAQEWQAENFPSELYENLKDTLTKPPFKRTSAPFDELAQYGLVWHSDEDGIIHFAFPFYLLTAPAAVLVGQFARGSVFHTKYQEYKNCQKEPTSSYDAAQRAKIGRAKKVAEWHLCALLDRLTEAWNQMIESCEDEFEFTTTPNNDARALGIDRSEAESFSRWEIGVKWKSALKEQH